MISTMPSERSIALGTAAKALETGNLAFLLGAGVSANRSSYLPLWAPMVYSILDKVHGQALSSETILKDWEGHLLNEAILHRLDRDLGEGRVASALNACFDTDAFSPIHEFVAYAMKAKGATALTTNYDLLIERAARVRHGTPVEVVKLHGSIDEPGSLRFTFPSVFQPLDDKVRLQAQRSLRGRTLVVGGYRGADEFDVWPLLDDEIAGPSSIVWTWHSSPPDDLIVSRVRRRPQSQVIQWPFDEFAATLAVESGLVNGYRRPLDQTFKGTANPNAPQWWEPRLDEWGRTIHREVHSKALLAWARVLEHVAPANPQAASPVLEAYARHLTAPDDALPHVYSKARILRWRRIQNSVGSAEFDSLVLEIQTMIATAKGGKATRDLTALLGLVLHEFGLFQQRLHKHEPARGTLEKAYQRRESIGDPDAAYSLFQMAMNAREAQRHEEGTYSALGPAMSFDELYLQLRGYAEIFAKSDPKNWANTIHNMAFVRELEVTGSPQNHQLLLWEDAYALYGKAAQIRERLRMPQLFHRSSLRLAGCEIHIAELASALPKPARCGKLAAAVARLGTLLNEKLLDAQIKGEARELEAQASKVARLISCNLDDNAPIKK